MTCSKQAVHDLALGLMDDPRPTRAHIGRCGGCATLARGYEREAELWSASLRFDAVPRPRRRWILLTLAAGILPLLGVFAILFATGRSDGAGPGTAQDVYLRMARVIERYDLELHFTVTRRARYADDADWDETQTVGPVALPKGGPGRAGFVAAGWTTMGRPLETANRFRFGPKPAPNLLEIRYRATWKDNGQQMTVTTHVDEATGLPVFRVLEYEESGRSRIEEERYLNLEFR